jgi:streptothricin acetyltransferase
MARMLTLTRASARQRRAATQLEDGFQVESELQPCLREGVLALEEVPVTPYFKRYPRDDAPEATRPASDDAAIEPEEDADAYLAHWQGELTGMIELSVAWNRYARVDNLVVDAAWRRRGIARALLEQAFRWCRERNLPGVMLETQNNNVAACRLYAHCGFQLGGFDREFYRGLDPRSREIALFWYWRPD